MKKTLLQAISWFMSLLVLVSTFSFTINKHYCGDILVDVAVFEEAAGCGMAKALESVLPAGCETPKMHCCSDEELTISGKDTLRLIFTEPTLDQKIFLTAFLVTYIDLLSGCEKETTFYKDYLPPPLISNIYKLHETYLI